MFTLNPGYTLSPNPVTGPPNPPFCTKRSIIVKTVNNVGNNRQQCPSHLGDLPGLRTWERELSANSETGRAPSGEPVSGPRENKAQGRLNGHKPGITRNN